MIRQPYGFWRRLDAAGIWDEQLVLELSVDNGQTIFVVSDLHMGDGGPRDNFAFDNKGQQFSLFLDFVEKQKAEIFVLGDLFEFWQANLSRAIIEQMPFLDRLARMNAAYIIGNHDADLEEFIDGKLLNHPFFDRMSGPFTRQIGGKQFKFMHGHELDPFNRDGTPSWGRILAILGGIIEDRKGSPLLSAGGFTEKSLLRIGRGFMWIWNMSVNRFEKGLPKQAATSFEDMLTPAQYPDKVKGILALYQKDRLAEGYDILVAGHTHKAGSKGNWYYNSGCWVGLRNNYLRISPDGSVSVCEWKNGRQIVIASPEQQQ